MPARPLNLSLVFVSVALGMVLSEAAARARVVGAFQSPFGLADTEGNSASDSWNRTDPARFQQVYQVFDVPLNPQLITITQIAYRPDRPLGHAFAAIVPDVQINLS